MPQKTGVCGWPLVPSKAFPGEDTLACPTCKGTNITMTIRPRYPGMGTGPEGRWRLGDPADDINICNTCNYVSDGGPPPQRTR